MGHKNPDRIAHPPSPLVALTLAEMHVAGWQLRADCPRCGIKLRVNLPALIKVHGPDAIGWGKAPPCPGLDCRDGQLVYAARAITSGSWVSLRTPADAATLDRWKLRRSGRDLGPRNT